MIGTAAAIIGSAVIGAGAQAYGASKAASASDKGTKAAVAQYQQTRADEAPFLQSGYGAVSSLNNRLRVTPQDASGQVIGTPTGAPPTQAGSAPAGVINMVQQPDGTWAAPATNALRATSNFAGVSPRIPDTGAGASGATPATPETTAAPAATAVNTTPGPNGTSNGYAPVGTYGNETNPTYSDPGAFNYDLADYKASPGYQWQVDQALKGTEATAAATGALRSGAAAKALQDRAQNIALQDFSNERNFARASYDTDRAYGRGVYQDNRDYLSGRFDTETAGLFNLANLGQAAASGSAAANSGTANALMTNAANKGGAAIAGANSISSLLGSGVNALTYANALKTPSLAQAVTAGVNANPLLF
jgi:hypothetical protein